MSNLNWHPLLQSVELHPQRCEVGIALRFITVIMLQKLVKTYSAYQSKTHTPRPSPHLPKNNFYPSPKFITHLVP